jgi:ABC-type bacteriocin/lantibiotic exporter with double-glycine peptidase domain
LLPISHRQQSQQADCLAACTAMILEYLQIPVNYARLRRLLNIRYFGAFFSDIERVAALGVFVRVDEGNIETIHAYLEIGLPVIVAVNTGPLQSYWRDAIGHAIVVVGIEEQTVYVNDPALPSAPQAIHINEFIPAWGEKDYLFAIIALEQYTLK